MSNLVTVLVPAVHLFTPKCESGGVCGSVNVNQSYSDAITCFLCWQLGSLQGIVETDWIEIWMSVCERSVWSIFKFSAY